MKSSSLVAATLGMMLSTGMGKHMKALSSAEPFKPKHKDTYPHDSYIHSMIGGTATEIKEWNKAVDAKNSLKLQLKLGLI